MCDFLVTWSRSNMKATHNLNRRKQHHIDTFYWPQVKINRFERASDKRFGQYPASTSGTIWHDWCELDHRPDSAAKVLSDNAK